MITVPVIPMKLVVPVLSTRLFLRLHLPVVVRELVMTALTTPPSPVLILLKDYDRWQSPRSTLRLEMVMLLVPVVPVGLHSRLPPRQILTVLGADGTPVFLMMIP